jgi:hypothetical protein
VQYMLMCCIDEYAWDRLPDSQKDKIMREYGTLIQDLVKSGQFRGGGQLHPTAAATTVRMNRGKLVFTDGPFAETKEQLGSYHLVECHDLDEAMAIAVRIPTLSAGGAIEVRPVALPDGGPR